MSLTGSLALPLPLSLKSVYGIGQLFNLVLKFFDAVHQFESHLRPG
tara:strand:- start:586 stop:723 length:138 start_codon:yes stop_codon:yes gene_type:complete